MLSAVDMVVLVLLWGGIVVRLSLFCKGDDSVQPPDRCLIPTRRLWAARPVSVAGLCCLWFLS